MVLNRRHIPWALFTILASAAAAVLYLANFHPEQLPFPFKLPSIFGPVPPVRNTVGGTPLGIVFGAISLGIFLFASALGIRKKRRTWPLGSVRMWLRAHIWLTILTVPLVLFHCGFQLGGMMTSTLMVLYGIVMVSGFWGLAMQQVLPRMMARSLTREVVFEQIPFIKQELTESAFAFRESLQSAARAATQTKLEQAAEHGGGTAVVTALDLDRIDQSIPVLRGFLDDDLIPYLGKSRGQRHRLDDPKVSEDVFRLLKANVDDRYNGKVDEMQNWADDRRSMDIQTRLQHWLHLWLIVHIPVSFALLIMTIWHAWITLTYL